MLLRPFGPLLLDTYQCFIRIFFHIDFEIYYSIFQVILPQIMQSFYLEFGRNRIFTESTGFDRNEIFCSAVKSFQNLKETIRYWKRIARAGSTLLNDNSIKKNLDTRLLSSSKFLDLFYVLKVLSPEICCC